MFVCGCRHANAHTLTHLHTLYVVHVCDCREVSKPRGSDYKLIWKSEPDFVRLAAKCDALIIPFAAVGADDAYDVVMVRVFLRNTVACM